MYLACFYDFIETIIKYVKDLVFQWGATRKVSFEGGLLLEWGLPQKTWRGF